MKKISFCILICCVFLLFSCENNTPHEHKWDDGTVTKVATCSSVGEKTFKCSCGATKTEEIAVNPNNHKVDNFTKQQADVYEFYNWTVLLLLLI